VLERKRVKERESVCVWCMRERESSFIFIRERRESRNSVLVARASVFAASGAAAKVSEKK